MWGGGGREGAACEEGGRGRSPAVVGPEVPLGERLEGEGGRHALVGDLEGERLRAHHGEEEVLVHDRAAAGAQVLQPALARGGELGEEREAGGGAAEAEAAVAHLDCHEPARGGCQCSPIMTSAIEGIEPDERLLLFAAVLQSTSSCERKS